MAEQHGRLVGTLKDVTSLSNPTQAPLASKDLDYIGTQYAKSFIPQEKLAEQALGAPKALSELRARNAATPTPRPSSTPLAVRPAPTIRPATTVREAPAPRPAPTTR